MKLKTILSILLVLPFLWSCNEEDDVKEIFDSGTWYVLDYFSQANLNEGSGKSKYGEMANSSNPQVAATGRKNLSIIRNFSIQFKSDGTFTGKLQNGDIEGMWEADGKSRNLRILFQQTPHPSTSLNDEFIQTMQEAVWYRGDRNVLLLAPHDQKSFLQLTHYPGE